MAAVAAELVRGIEQLAIHEDFHLSNSQVCYRRYMNFIRDAVAEANNYPNQVTLYLTTEPYTHLITLHSVIQLIRNVPFKRVLFLFRSYDISGMAKKISKATPSSEQGGTRNEVRDYLQNTDTLQIWISAGPKGFHTKWAAYEREGDENATVLLTSATLSYSHLSPEQRGKPNFNSLAILNVSKEAFYNMFTTVMREKCGKGLKIYILNKESKFIITDITGYCGDRQHDGIRLDWGNFTDIEVYQKMCEFINKKRDTPCTIWIVSPFITNNEKVPHCYTLQNMFHVDIYLDQHPNVIGVKVVHKPVTRKKGTLVVQLRPRDNKIRYVEQISGREFHCKLVACVPENPEEEVDIIWTSANFSQQHMKKRRLGRAKAFANVDWVVPQNMRRNQWHGIAEKLGLTGILDEQNGEYSRVQRWADMRQIMRQPQGRPTAAQVRRQARVQREQRMTEVHQELLNTSVEIN